MNNLMKLINENNLKAGDEVLCTSAVNTRIYTPNTIYTIYQFKTGS